MKDYKIFDISYLIDSELTEEDLYFLFETNSLLYSLIISMFKEAKYNIANDVIIKICTTEIEWFNKYFWTANQRKSFENKLIEAYKNIYQCSNILAKSKMELFIIKFGLSKKKKYIHKKH